MCVNNILASVVDTYENMYMVATDYWMIMGACNFCLIMGVVKNYELRPVIKILNVGKCFVVKNLLCPFLVVENKSLTNHLLICCHSLLV